MQDLQKPIWQVMASGMHETTADGLDRDCPNNETCCGWNHDVDGLRGPERSCNLYGSTNFGSADFDWSALTVKLQINRGDGKGAAKGVDGKDIQVTIGLDSCEAV